MLNQTKLPEPEILPSLRKDKFLPPARRWVRTGTMLLLGVLVGGAGLTGVIRYDITVPAIATVQPKDGLSAVRAAAKGTIKRVFVTENQPVHEGDIIAKFDTADQAQLTNLQSRRRKIQDYIQQYQTQIEQIEQQLQALNPQLEKQRERWQQQRQSLIRQIRYDQATLRSIHQELSQLAIIAPTNGTLFQLQLQNPGQVVQPGNVVAQVVSDRGSFIFEARIDGQDAPKIEVGQTAYLRITASPYLDYEVLRGTVQAIAPDVTVEHDSNTNTAISYYELTIQPEHPYLTKGDRPYPLQPGMEAHADIITGNETIMQSLLRQMQL